LKKNLSQKKEADGVAQGEGPEFKLQYQKKKKKKVKSEYPHLAPVLRKKNPVFYH
jgi:hypothetical protein